MQNRLLGLPMKKRLKNYLAPKINMPFTKLEEQITPRLERQKKRKIMKDVQDRLKDLSPVKTCIANIISEVDINENNDREDCQNYEMLLKDVQNLNFQLRCTRSELPMLKEEKRSKFKIMARKIKRTQHYRRETIAEVKKLKRKLRILEEENTK